MREGTGAAPRTQPRADGLVAAPAQLPAVLLRSAGLGRRDLDAERRAVLPRARPDPPLSPAGPHQRGQVPAHVAVRPDRRGVRGPDGPAARAVRDPDAVRAARGGL